MSNPNLGKPPVPDYSRVHRATDPKLRGPIPAINVPMENANQTLDKVVVTMNRGGSNARNPLLSGLGIRFEFHIGTTDEAKAFYIFRDRANLGVNMKNSLGSLGPGIFYFDHLLGSGQSEAGDKDIGAKKNYLRLDSRGGAIEREFWIKEYEADVVACNGQNALDTETLEPVPIELSMADAGDDGFIDVMIDYMVSWSDEFQKMHRGENPHLNPGALKSYGGAAYVSHFQTGEDEGVGTEISPVTQAVINDQHTIKVQATVGTKHATIRFRSKEDSEYFVDVDILFEVVEAGGDTPICNAPWLDENVNIYIPPPPGPPPDYPDPPYTPDTPSTPTDDPTNVPDPTTMHPDPTIPNTPTSTVKRGVITLNGQRPGGSNPVLVKVVRWGVTAPNQYWYRGAVMSQFGDTLWYNPYVTDMQQSGAQGDPYDARKKYTICLDLDADETAQICFYTVSLYHINDQGIHKQSEERMISGPYWRNMSGLPQPNLGYGPGSCGGSGFPNIADNGSCPV